MTKTEAKMVLRAYNNWGRCYTKNYTYEVLPYEDENGTLMITARKWPSWCNDHTSFIEDYMMEAEIPFADLVRRAVK